MEKEIREHMEKSIENMKAKFAEIRVGRAHISMVDHIQVDCYGDKMTLNQVATLSTPDAMTIVVQPWDKKLIKEIEKDIRKDHMDWNPMNDGEVIKIKLPEVTSEKRKEQLKTVKKILEECKVSLRNVRKNFNTKVKKSEDLSEDQMHAQEKVVQNITDEYMKKVDDVYSQKEKDLLKYV